MTEEQIARTIGAVGIALASELDKVTDKELDAYNVLVKWFTNRIRGKIDQCDTKGPDQK